MIYIVIAAVILLIIAVTLIIYGYKADNKMIAFTEKINTSYEQINAEMHRKEKKICWL